MSPKWVIVLALVSGCQVNSEQVSTFGGYCGEAGFFYYKTRCDSTKFLTCHSYKCWCLDHNKMTYDKGRDKCVAFVGKRCTKTSNSNLDCIQNAKCNDANICECETNYFANTQGSCTPKRFDGGTCQSDYECRTDVHLSCQQGICSCNITDSSYDSEKKKCVGLVNTTCRKYGGDCVKNAECSSESSPNHWTHQNSSLITPELELEPQCQCQRYFIKTQFTGRCIPRLEHGSSCGSSVESVCREDFACIDGKCSCPFPNDQYNTNGRSPCISYVHGPCKEEMDGEPREFKCVDNALCRNSSGAFEFECQCQPYYIKSYRTGFCLPHLEYGASCGPLVESICREDFDCINGKCSCPFPKYQHNTNGTNPCISHVNGPCMEEVDGEIWEFQCVDNARCRNSSGVFECRCDKGYIESPDGRCEIAYGQPCQLGTNITCDTTAKLVCNNGKCSCQDFEIYNGEENMCRGLVGAQCSGPEVGKARQYCVDGALCGRFRIYGYSREQWHGTCRCKHYFGTNSNRTCAYFVEKSKNLDKTQSRKKERSNALDEDDGTYKLVETLEKTATAQYTFSSEGISQKTRANIVQTSFKPTTTNGYGDP